MSRARDKAAVNRGYKLLPHEIRVPGDTENRRDIRRRDISAGVVNERRLATHDLVTSSSLPQCWKAEDSIIDGSVFEIHMFCVFA